MKAKYLMAIACLGFLTSCSTYYAGCCGYSCYYNYYPCYSCPVAVVPCNPCPTNCIDHCYPLCD